MVHKYAYAQEKVKLSVSLLRRKAFIKDKTGLTKCGSGESANDNKTLLAEDNDPTEKQGGNEESCSAAPVGTLLPDDS